MRIIFPSHDGRIHVPANCAGKEMFSVRLKMPLSQGAVAVLVADAEDDIESWYHRGVAELERILKL